jgi:lipopolysaccharide transport system permease protein
VRTFLDHFRELYRHRVLVGALVWRDIKARYRGSVLGYLWTLLNPMLLLGVYSLVFTKYTRAVDLPHYPVFLFVGILPWLWLSSAIASGANAIIGGASLITRVCIPPQVLPAVTVLSTAVNFGLALPLALGAAAAVGLAPAASLLLLPVVVVLELLFLYAIALSVSALSVRFRDVGFLLQSVLTMWFFMTPVAYPIASVPYPYRDLLMANPASPLFLTFQDIVFFRRDVSPLTLGLALLWTATLLVLGVRVFESRRDTFAEEI